MCKGLKKNRVLLFTREEFHYIVVCFKLYVYEVIYKTIEYGRQKKLPSKKSQVAIKNAGVKRFPSSEGRKKNTKHEPPEK